MLLPVLILVAVQGKHDNLEEAVDLPQGDLAGQVGNVLWARLEQKEEPPIELE